MAAAVLTGGTRSSLYSVGVAHGLIGLRERRLRSGRANPRLALSRAQRGFCATWRYLLGDAVQLASLLSMLPRLLVAGQSSAVRPFRAVAGVAAANSLTSALVRPGDAAGQLPQVCRPFTAASGGCFKRAPVFRGQAARRCRQSRPVWRRKTLGRGRNPARAACPIAPAPRSLRRWSGVAGFWPA
jgi:hypothetical protein